MEERVLLGRLVEVDLGLNAGLDYQGPRGVGGDALAEKQVNMRG